jgi:uncharacterized protein YigE (DUF2233 family)
MTASLILRVGAAAAAIASVAPHAGRTAHVAHVAHVAPASPAVQASHASGGWFASHLAQASDGPAAASAASSPGLAVWTGSRWRTFWSADRAPAVWQDGHPAVLDAIAWREAARGIEVAELRLSGPRSTWRLRVVLVRLDPDRLDLGLRAASRESGLLGAWTVDSLPAGAGIAVNAGQFDGGSPWGWHVQESRELQRPGSGPLAMAFVVDTAGAVRLLQAAEIEEARQRGGIVTAFQSYPAVLMDDGVVPAQLLAPGRGVDVTHRDARLGLGAMRDGRIVLALTRFDALGEAGGRVPFGPTTPEMAALMGALGCTRAVLLDGGISAQLAVRSDDGAVRSWPGMRRVPLGLIATVRSN